MLKKIQKVKVARIIQLRKKCDCGKKVTDHHWLCNGCWGKKAKQRAHAKPNLLLFQAKCAEQRKLWGHASEHALEQLNEAKTEVKKLA